MQELLRRFTKSLPSFSLNDKISAAAAAFAVLVALFTLGSLAALREQRLFHDRFEVLAASSRNIERANAAIYAVVMESRGIYMSPDRNAARRYADSQLVKLGQLTKIVEEWQELVTVDDASLFAPFKQRIDQFVTFRTEMARRTISVGSSAARELGDNDDNRAVRTALNEDLERLSRLYDDRMTELDAAADARGLVAFYLGGIGVLLVVLIAAAALALRRGVLMPLLDIARVTDRIASGRIKLTIPHARRHDEIGRVAHAVETFQNGVFRIQELEQHELQFEQQQADVLRERDRLEQGALSSQQRLDAAVANMAQALIMLDSFGYVLVVNEQYRELYGVPASIARPGAHVRDILAHRARLGLLREKPADFLAALRQRMKDGKPTTTEFELGDGRIIRVCERPMAGGGWIATHEDFTVQRRNERILARAEYFLAALLENIPQAVLAKDAQSLRYVFVNRAAETLFGLPRTEIIGRTPRELFSEPTGSILEEAAREQLAGRGDDEAQAHNIVTPGNGSRDIVVRRLPISIGEGEPKFLLSIIEDRTAAQRVAA
ncbi:PAS-domain containing protein [Bradyrhizobium ontarionense]|uniref:PAS-domain containing protein n=1 Tax=Bradyrhizobium ontarionense TaxID=2898149 RepID=A0ABY3R6J7_9BRAD|nr:PAS-domain containing protein [Bradyrhizobium sp. A19]UFZ02520.1 PAS-domain containing protein [Bradyrhizobium sp. A19]